MTIPAVTRVLLGRLVRAAAIAATALVFVVSVDAQWLKHDDFTMIEQFRVEPLSALLRDILGTRTTPHVRFAFIEHLLLIPFFRWGGGSRLSANLLYALTIAALLAAGWSVTRRLRLAAWLAAWTLYSAALFSTTTWATLEFKTAGYLLHGFALVAALLALSIDLGRRDSPPSPALVAGWVALAFAAFHTAELALVPAFLLAAALAIRGRLPRWVPVAAMAWPLAYWLANVLLSGRPVGLLGLGRPPTQGQGIAAAIGWAMKRAGEGLAPELGLLLIAVAGAVSATWADQRWRERVATALEVVALPAGGAALLVLTQMNSLSEGLPGYLSPRHFAFAQLSMVGGPIAALAIAHERAARRPLANGVAALVLAASAALLATRLPPLFRHIETAREELASTLVVQRQLQRLTLGALPEREVLVFVPSWPQGSPAIGDVEPTFLAASWSRQSFARSFSCGGDACPRVTYFPNFSWFRTRLSQEERDQLCRRVLAAEVFVTAADGVLSQQVTDRWSASRCAEWLSANRLVDLDGAQ